jgi:hypothetical protein
VSSQLKSEASESFVKTVQAIEDTADLCHQNLRLLTYPGNLASWAVLSRIVLQIEQTVVEHGYRTQTHSTVAYNLARGGAQALAWIRSFSSTQSASLRQLSLNTDLFASATEALWTALSYESFTTVFPLWHKSAIRADLIKTNVIRFSGEDKDSQRVRAYLQGLRPIPDREAPLELGKTLEPAVQKKIRDIAKSAGDDRSSFSYSRPMRLYDQLHQRYFELSGSQFRHEDSLLVGKYALGELRNFYSALLAVCAVHEHACFVRAQLMGAYPANSGVMVHRREEWVKLLSKISRLPGGLVSDIIGDLVFGATKTLDLYVHPFVPLGDKPQLLGVVPHFPLRSRSDENIFRVCSQLRPTFYDVITNAKEEQMRRDLTSRTHTGFQIRGPRELPGDLPDIDLVIEDTSNSTAVIAELKWLRKGIRSVEHIRQEADFLYGVGQVEKVKAYLLANSQFLFDRRDLSEDLRKFKNVYYILIPRDFFVWIDPAKGVPAIDYDAFSLMLTRHKNLAEGMSELLTYDWLPREGREFGIKYETFTVNSVGVETEVIYANY